MTKCLEETLACHCGETLAGIKPANLICCTKEAYPDIGAQLKVLNSQLNGKGIYFLVLCSCQKRDLVLVYRPKLLSQHLEDARVRRFLAQNGYPADRGLAQMLAFLQKRIQQQEQFPHEIGVFLGYPIEDIEGFVRHKGQNYQYSGYWKVYANVEDKKQMFARYTRCRKAILKRVHAGISIAQLFKAS